MTEPADKARPDWERIEADYRAGVKSVREIAAEHGVSHTAIQKRAKAHDWTRDLAAKVRAKADALVAKNAVAKEVATATKITEVMTVEVEAQVQARIRLTHRQDIGRTRLLAMKLLEELETTTERQDLVEQLRDALADEEKSNEGRKRLWEAWQRFAALPGRVDSLKKMAETLRILIDKEREAYGIETKGGGSADGLPFVSVKDLTGRK